MQVELYSAMLEPTLGTPEYSAMLEPTLGTPEKLLFLPWEEK